MKLEYSNSIRVIENRKQNKPGVQARQKLVFEGRLDVETGRKQLTGVITQRV